ncbi:MAG: hypothetical protein ACPGJV_05710 [Bacteriovoracaceae bacterium]
MKIKFNIPYSQDKDALQEHISSRLQALALFNKTFKKYVSPFPLEEIKTAIKTNAKLPAKLVGDRSPFHINDFDLAEAFITNIFSRADTLSDNSVKFFDSEHLYIKDDDRIAGMRKVFLRDSKTLRQWNYSRIRAKLIFWELVSVINRSEKAIFDLVSITPKYLGSEYVEKRIAQCRYKLKHTTKSDKFNDELTKAIKGDLRSKARKYNYWSLDYYYSEVSECIKAYNKIDDEKGKENYLAHFSQYWDIPENIKELIKSDPKKYSLLTIEAMVANDLIPDATTYTHTIKPYVKIIKENIKYLRACHVCVERFLDLPTKKPEIFQKIYIWDDIENYNFKELQNFQPEKRFFHLES